MTIALLIGGAQAFAVKTLVNPILFPRVISYPWPSNQGNDPQEKKMTVVLAGSYNPPHLGHLAMLTHLSER
jgi:hypothetical protein